MTEITLIGGGKGIKIVKKKSKTNHNKILNNSYKKLLKNNNKSKYKIPKKNINKSPRFIIKKKILII